MASAKCKWCHRRLKNPKWIDLEAGPVCYRKHGQALVLFKTEDK